MHSVLLKKKYTNKICMAIFQWQQWHTNDYMNEKETERKSKWGKKIAPWFIKSFWFLFTMLAAAHHFAICLSLCVFSFRTLWNIVRGIYYHGIYNIWIVLHGDCDAFLNCIFSSIAFLCPFSHRPRQWRLRRRRWLSPTNLTYALLSLNGDHHHHHHQVEPNAAAHMFAYIHWYALGIGRSRNEI